MKLIPLTQGKFAKVDDDMFEELAKHRWYVGNNGYAIRNASKKRTSGNAHIMMHRVINQTPDGMETDHINSDSLDNRKCNLRSCTSSQNKMNRGSRPNSLTGYKGVCFFRKTNRTKKYMAVISKDGVHKYLGYFLTAEEASQAYQSVVKQFHGEFSRVC